MFCRFLLTLLLATFPQKKISDQDAVKLAQTAAEASTGGNAAAEFLLGDSYEHGKGMPQDYAEALKWYVKSAEKGYPSAQVALAWLYFGHGPGGSADKNFMEAYFWADVALASHLPPKSGGLTKDGKQRALLLKKMIEGGTLQAPNGDKSLSGLLSPAQIAEAQARATKWLTEHRETSK